MSHTPGPWKITADARHDGDRRIYRGEIAKQAIAKVYANDWTDSEGMAASNARLIAAAPDLLLACQRLRAHISLLDLDEMPSHMIDELRDASAAIAKAEGK